VLNQDADLRHTWIHNPSLGFLSEQIIGKTDADLLPEKEAVALTAIKQQVLATGKSMRQNIRATIAGETVGYDLTVEPFVARCRQQHSRNHLRRVSCRWVTRPGADGFRNKQDFAI
jgi:hypothetical protein